MTDNLSTSSSAIPNSVLEAYTSPDHEKFQKIREKYHRILDSLQKRINENGDAGIANEELGKVLKEANIVFSDVKRPQEARLDISVLKQVLQLAKSNIEKTTSNILEFKPSEFADNLINYSRNLTNDALPDLDFFDLPETSLRGLEEEMSLMYTETCGLEPIYGALEWKAPERKISHKAAVDRTPAVAKLIEKVSDLTTKEENPVDEVSRIFGVLKSKFYQNKCQPLHYLEFVMNPQSFSKTIENIFHVSFLLRDGYVEIAPDKFKVPCISPITRTENITSSSGSDRSGCQAILSMDMNEWKEAIEVLELNGREPMIPVISKAGKKRTI